jgi:hypothetical protein
MPIFGVPMPDTDQVNQAIDVFVGFQDDMSATATVTAIGPTARNMSLPAKTARSRPAVTRFAIDFYLIDKHEKDDSGALNRSRVNNKEASTNYQCASTGIVVIGSRTVRHSVFPGDGLSVSHRSFHHHILQETH